MADAKNPRWIRKLVLCVFILALLVYKDMKMDMGELRSAHFSWQSNENRSNDRHSPNIPPPIYLLQSSNSDAKVEAQLDLWTFLDPRDGKVRSVSSQPDRVRKMTRWTSPDVQEALREGRLQLKNQVQLVNSDDDRLQERVGRYYSFEDAAKLLSHLTVLLQASRENRNEILVLEDTALLTPDLFQHFHAYQAMAPSDWTILQWTTTNIPTLEQGLILQDPWGSWLPDIHGTHAYSIKRKGMDAILEALYSHDKDTGRDIWTFGQDFDFQLLTDELLFSVGGAYQIVYTSTYPWILTDDLQRKVEARQIDLKASMASKLIPPTRNETLLGFMSVRFESLKHLPAEFEHMLQDVDAVCKIHRFSKCDWIIKAVKAKKNLSNPANPNSTVPTWDQVVVNVPSNIQLEVVQSFERFNKFELLKKHVEKMGKYDLVLFKDADQRLSGFPWASFVHRIDGALMAGPLRQAPLESFLHVQGLKKSQHFLLHNAQEWKLEDKNPLWTNFFVTVKPLDVVFLEMYFDVFDGRFAEWFFSKVLTPEFTKNDVSWGPDFLWCPLAREYQPNRTSCRLIPLISVHEDSRQLHKERPGFGSKGKQQNQYFQNSPTFGPWFQESFDYVTYGMKHSKLDQIVEKCRILLGTVETPDAPVDISKCLTSRDWKRLKPPDG
jgi:GR25 family glycosyltransferase involved in LPS biosynthesis